MATPKINITLQETFNRYYLSVADLSQYPTNWNITNPSLEITPPGFNKVNVAFTPKTVSHYTSSHLGITCDEDMDMALPDGIYLLKYSIHPNLTHFVEKSFMRVYNIWCQYEEKFLELNLSQCCPNKKQSMLQRELDKIDMLINSSVAAANACDSERAYREYNLAQQLLNNLDCNC